MRLGAVVLALLTVAAVVFAVLNFQQRSSFVLPDDGVTWMDTTSGVTAWHIVKDSPAAKAGIKPGDIVDTVRGFSIRPTSPACFTVWLPGWRFATSSAATAAPSRLPW